MTAQRYVYKITEVVKVVDGDTVHAKLDVGFRQSLLAHIRLDGYDTPERNSGSAYEKRQALLATDVTATFLASNVGNLWVQTKPDPDSFGRWLGVIWAEHDGEPDYLGARLAAQGLATVWPTRWRQMYG